MNAAARRIRSSGTLPAAVLASSVRVSDFKQMDQFRCPSDNWTEYGCTGQVVMDFVTRRFLYDNAGIMQFLIEDTDILDFAKDQADPAVSQSSIHR